jgi:hypothetical protein
MSSSKCDDCSLIFKTQSFLDKHKKVSIECNKYKHILFTCTFCFFVTKGLKNINKHILTCNTNDIRKDNEHNIFNSIKNLKTKKPISSESKIIEKLQLHLNLEKIKNKIFINLIQNNTNININDIILENEQGINIYNLKDDIPLIVHNYIQTYPNVSFISEVTESNIRIAENPPPKKNNYRKIKSNINLTNEINEDILTTKIQDVDTKIQEIVKCSENIEITKNNFSKCFSNMRQTRIYTKTLSELKTLRMSIFSNLSISEYIVILLEHIETLETIFKEKKYDNKKINDIISKGLSPLESRLSFYGSFKDKYIDADELSKLSSVIDIYSNYEKTFIPFDYAKFNNFFFNYTCVLFPIKTLLEKYLTNRYGFTNLIYLPLQKNTIDDPFSFYTLESVNKKRFWKMDCRLEFFCNNFISNVIPFMINLFRKLYKSVFNDNEFRPDFNTNCPIAEYDCEQLLQNILTVSQPRKFCNIIRKIVCTVFVYTPTENDKFNLYGDDVLQRKKFQEKDDCDLVDIFKQLFDGISSTDAVDFYRTKSL